MARHVDVLVIGAGQAGLSAAHHLQRRGFTASGSKAPSYAVLDAEAGPGGAWRHRWQSLRMATVNGIADLPGQPQAHVDPCEPSSEFITRYFADYEAQLELAIHRPVKVLSVRRLDETPHSALSVSTDSGTWTCRALINATGTWTKPFWPWYPGQDSFRGQQLHVADYVAAEAFTGRHVAVVGGGISAVQLLDEISHVTSTSWFTRREPIWRDAPFTEEAGRAAVAMVEDRVRQGLPPRSVVSVTGLIWTPELRAAQARGALDRQPMFTEILPTGVRTATDQELAVDVILWATGFRAALDHLRPLRLREPGGGITMDETQVAAEPRVHLIGYGPSASTIGANRAGRAAVHRILQWLSSSPQP